jgi:hypothetical protein
VADQVDVPHGFAVRDQDREPGERQGPSWLFAFTQLTEPEGVEPDTAGDFFRLLSAVKTLATVRGLAARVLGADSLLRIGQSPPGPRIAGAFQIVAELLRRIAAGNVMPVVHDPDRL